MGSDNRYLLAFGGGLYVVCDRRLKDQAYCSGEYYEHPKDVGQVQKNGKNLYIAGGKSKDFKAIQVEIYGISKPTESFITSKKDVINK